MSCAVSRNVHTHTQLTSGGRMGLHTVLQRNTFVSRGLWIITGQDPRYWENYAKLNTYQTCVCYVSLCISLHTEYISGSGLNCCENACRDIKCSPPAHLSLQLWPYMGSQKHTHSRSVASGSFLTVESIWLLIFLVSFNNLVSHHRLQKRKKKKEKKILWW